MPTLTLNHRIAFFLRTLMLLLLPFFGFSQVITGDTRPVQFPELASKFTKCEVYRIDAAKLAGLIQNNPLRQPVTLNLGSHQWELDLAPSEIWSKDYFLQVHTENGIQKIQPTEQKAFKGQEIRKGGNVRLTVDDDFIYGVITQGKESYFIEPLRYFVKDAPKDEFVVYRQHDFIPGGEHTCGVEDTEHHIPDIAPKIVDSEDPAAAMMVNCYSIELAIAADKLMFQSYGSISGVESHVTGVMNNVAGNYVGQFNFDIEFNIVTIFVETVNDPWTSSTNAGALLNSFTNWGEGGGFGINYDLGQLWTDRDFDGGTVGIAWLSDLCNGYHCLQDFTSNADLLRCMTAHEIGHNLSATHDPNGCSQWIMCPTVSFATDFSTASKNSINNFVIPFTTNGCLSTCGPPPPPLVADFDFTPDPACAMQPVQFTDMSTGTITSRLWQFSGGVPSTSTQPNPTSTWSVGGTYNVTLTVNGPGGSSSITKQVVITPKPVASFTYTVDGTTVFFTNQSTDATDYYWTFGDGGESFESDPQHTYAIGGIYTVVLTVTSPCGTSTKTIPVNTAPTADPSATPISGCAPLAVQYFSNATSNTSLYIWSFPGGQPSSSTQQNPVILYQTPGSYNFSLTVSNNAGNSTYSQTNFISVAATASANFTSASNGLTVTFTNTSTNGTSYLWNFGDGQTSTQTNPVHTYSAGGTYSVTLTATNTCGSSTATLNVTVTAPPVASFTATPQSGCAPLVVQFTNTSSGNPTSYNWTFPGGNPATSNLPNPQVTYNTPGVYQVILTVSNSSGSNTATVANYITVNGVPTTSFSSTINGATASFTNNSTGATGYLWSFGDGQTSTQNSPNHTYSSDGNYTVTLTANNACGSSTSTQTITVVTPPTAAFTANTTSGCAPLSVQFTSTSSPNTTAWSWQFPGGNPASSTVQNPTVVYAAPGQYSVTLTVSNAAGSATASQTNFITVNTVPNTGFNASTNNAVATFTNTTTGATAYSWNFGDGGSSTAANPTHTYTADGTYTVTLSATNACGTTTATKTVTIVTPPTAAFTANNTSGCAPLTVQFTSTASPNTTGWSWQFPGGNPASSTVQNPTVVYAAPGQYSVTLTVSNAAGSATASQTNFITVNTVPNTGFNASTNNAVATFTNTTTGATTYSWNFGDGGNSTSANPTHTYAADGTYTVTLSATNACGTTTATKTVTIVTPPTAAFTANNTSGCAPLSVQFTSTASANATGWSWQFPGGNPASSTVQNPTVTYAAPGQYSVTLTVSNSAGSATASQTNFITVNTVPNTDFNASTNNTVATFTNTTTGATSYSWNFGDGGNSTAANPTHTYTADGTYTVILSATNACGTTTATKTVTIVTPPSASFIVNNTTGCAPMTVQFTSTASANTVSWNWLFPGGNPSSSTAPNPTVVYDQPGQYSVTLTVSNAAGNSTTTQTNLIGVGVQPTAGFTTSVNGVQVSFNNTSVGGVSYTWNFGDNNTSTEANPDHTYAGDGQYMVTQTVNNACGAAVLSQMVTITTPPTAGFTLVGNSGCSPFEAEFTNTSSANAVTYDWTFEGGTPASSSEKSPKVSWNTPGNYVITLVATNSAGSSIYMDTITVLGAPTAGFNYQIAGLTLLFSNTSLNGTTYLWDFGDGKTSTEVNPEHNYEKTGSFSVVLQVVNQCDTAVFTSTVELIGNPPLPQYEIESEIGCAPFTVQFNDVSAGSPLSWQWSFPGGTPPVSNIQNPVVVYATPGVYPVTLSVTNIYGVTSTVFDSAIIVLGNPIANFIHSVDIFTANFQNASIGATDYFWNFGDGTTSTEQNPQHTYQTPGTYNVTLSATNLCGSAVFESQVVILTSNQEAAWGKSLNIYPNPNTGSFTIAGSGIEPKSLQYSLFNSLGQLIDRQEIPVLNGQLVHNFGYKQLPAGIYQVELVGNGKSVVKAIAIER